MKQFSEKLKKVNLHWKKWKKKIRQEQEEHALLPWEHQKTEKDEQNNRMQIEISPFSVFQAMLVILGVLFLYQIALQIADIVILFLIALFLSATLNPAVSRMESWRISRSIGVILLLLLIFGFLIVLLGRIIPLIAEQLGDIANDIQGWVRGFVVSSQRDQFSFLGPLQGPFWSLLDQINSEKIMNVFATNIEGIADNLTDFAGKGVALLSSTIEMIFNVMLVILLTFFLVSNRENLNSFFHSLFPDRHQEYLTNKMQLIQEKIGNWVHGQFLLFFIVGTCAYIFFRILGIPYALTLAMVFGVAEFVPYLGPAFSFLVSAPIAFNESLGMGMSLVAFYAALQFLEGNILVPLVMKKAVGLPPIVTLLALIVGTSFPEVINPILGMILAVPIATILSLFVRDLTSAHVSPKKEVD